MILEAIFSQPMHPIRTAIGRLHVLGAIFEAKAETAAQDRLAAVQGSAAPTAARAPKPPPRASEGQGHDVPGCNLGSDRARPASDTIALAVFYPQAVRRHVDRGLAQLARRCAPVHVLQAAGGDARRLASKIDCQSILTARGGGLCDVVYRKQLSNPGAIVCQRQSLTACQTRHPSL
jgi:hypothetical protein